MFLINSDSFDSSSDYLGLLTRPVVFCRMEEEVTKPKQQDHTIMLQSSVFYCKTVESLIAVLLFKYVASMLLMTIS